METPESGAEARLSSIRDLKWPPVEKKIGRQAFDRALQREFDAVIRETKRLAAEIQQSDDLWDLENYLREQRKAIDSRFETVHRVDQRLRWSFRLLRRFREEQNAGSAGSLGVIACSGKSSW